MFMNLNFSKKDHNLLSEPLTRGHNNELQYHLNITFECYQIYPDWYIIGQLFNLLNLGNYRT